MRERFSVVKTEGWSTPVSGSYAIVYAIHDEDYAGRVVAEFKKNFYRPLSLRRLEDVRQSDAVCALRYQALLHARKLNVLERRALEA